MHDLLVMLGRYAWGTWRYRWYAVLAAWVVCLVGWHYVFKMPDQYEASAKIHVDTQTLFRPLLKGLAITTDTGQRVGLMTKTLLTRPNLEKLARMTDLDIRATTPQQMDALTDSLANRIVVSAADRSGDIYNISFEDRDPQVAKRVVQSLITIFVEGALGGSRADSSTVQQFLGQQIREYEKKLRDGEKRLADFKRENVGVLPGSGSSYYSRLEATVAELKEAELLAQEAERRREELRHRLEDAELGDDTAFAALVPDLGYDSSPLTPRIINLQSRLDELLLTYTERHPDVIELRRLIAQLEEQRAREQRDMPAPAGVENPIVQQINMMLLESDAQVAAMQARVDEYQQRVGALQNLVDTVPQVEASLAELNRDYELNRSNYQQLMARRESALLGEQAELSGGDVRIKVIEPPHVPDKPSGPLRPVFLSLVLLGSLGVGIGLSFLLSQLRPVFLDTRMLSEIAGLPVLGSVTLASSPYARRQRLMGAVAFGSATITLLLVYGGGMAVEVLEIDLQSRIGGLLRSV